MGFSLRTLRVLALLGLGSSALAFALCEAAAATGAKRITPVVRSTR